MKTSPHVEDQLPTVLYNVQAVVGMRPLKDHKIGFMGKTIGPMMVAFGHELPDGRGIGPDIPACNGLCWVCCCFGMPCSIPAGKGVAKTKSNFNNTVYPKKGKGMTR